MRIDDESLFSPDPEIRWDESRRWSTKYRWNKKRINKVRLAIQENRTQDINENDVDPLVALPERFHDDVCQWGKHFALCGSLNSWIVFIGPSPGCSPSTSNRLNDLLDTAFHHRNPVLGYPHPTLYYPDSAGFFNEIREWVNGAYNSAGYFNKTRDEFGALSSFMMLNLTKEPRGSSKNVSHESMALGATRFWQDVAPVIRPRLIVSLTRGDPSVFDILRSAATRIGLGSESLPATKLSRYYLPNALVHTKSGEPILMATVPTHPSHVQRWVNIGRIQSRSDVIEHIGVCIRKALART